MSAKGGERTAIPDQIMKTKQRLIDKDAATATTAVLLLRQDMKR